MRLFDMIIPAFLQMIGTVKQEPHQKRRSKYIWVTKTRRIRRQL